MSVCQKLGKARSYLLLKKARQKGTRKRREEKGARKKARGREGASIFQKAQGREGAKGARFTTLITVAVRINRLQEAKLINDKNE